jgi:uncharacterized protein YkwD
MRKLMIGGVMLLITVFTATTAHTAQPPATADRFKQEFLDYINTKRSQGCNCGTKWFPPAPPLTWNINLQKAAYGHAKDMNDKKYFSHMGKDGRNMEDRIVLAGYIFNGYKSFNVGENIAYGQQSIQQVMYEWFKSEGHCHNLMNPEFKEVGIVQYNDYWVQDFGGRETFSPELQKQIESGQVKLKAAVKTTHHD